VTVEERDRMRRRRDSRLEVLRRRLLAGSVFSFAGFIGLVSLHHAGAKKSQTSANQQPAVASASTASSWFDQNDQNYSFDDSGVVAEQAQAPQNVPSASAPAPPPVAQTSVS
jgi:hypothetical protein